jgi:hypothetical protein
MHRTYSKAALPFHAGVKGRVGLRSASIDFLSVDLQRSDELIEKRTQSLRVGLLRYQSAELSPVFFVNSHYTIEGKNMTKSQARDC